MRVVRRHRLREFERDCVSKREEKKEESREKKGGMREGCKRTQREKKEGREFERECVRERMKERKRASPSDLSSTDLMASAGISISSRILGRRERSY